MLEVQSGALLEPAIPDGDSSISRETYHVALRAFADVAAALTEVRDLDALLHLIAMRTCELAGMGRCSVYLRDEETGLFRGQVAHPGGIGDERIKRLVAGVPADRFTQEIAETKRPVVIKNAQSDPRPIRSTMRAWHVRSMLGVPMVLNGEVIGILFLDTEDECHTFPPSVCAIASTFADLAAVTISQGRMAAELRRSMTRAAQQNRLLRRAAAMDDRMAGLLLDGGGLAEIATAVAELTEKPTAIHDAGHRRLAGAVPPWFDEEILPRLLDLPYREQPSVAEALDGLSETRGGVIGPLPAAGLPQRFLVAPVTMRGEECGHVVVMEYGSRFGPLDLHIARRAATNVALELAAERRAAGAEWDARASLTADLIRGTPDVGALEGRMAYLGIDPRTPRVLCLVAGDPPIPDGVPGAETFSAALAEAAGAREVLAAAVAEGVVALLDLPTTMATLEAIPAARAVVERALEALGAAEVTATLSTRCVQPADYVRAYGEAREVLGWARSLPRNGNVRVITADDLGAGRLLLSSPSVESARRFARDTLGALLSGDEATRGLLTTLEVFFDCGRSVRRSAVELGVHENTIRYRLTRIDEATGLAVGTSSDDEFAAQVALLSLRLDGALPPRPAPAL